MTDSRFDKFDPSTIAPASTIVILAKRGAGKSFLCRDLINHLSYFPSVTIICPTDKETRSYDEFVDDSCIHYDFSDSLIEKIVLLINH